MEGEITRAAGLILPESSVDVMAYGCTSGSLFIGPETIHKLIHKVGRISPESIRQVVLDLGSSEEVDTIFISCTNLRALSILEELENELDKPVISSNAALGWHCLRLAQVNEHLPHYGRLLSRSTL
jgi:maleate cis-trans isomerase